MSLAVEKSIQKMLMGQVDPKPLIQTIYDQEALVARLEFYLKKSLILQSQVNRLQKQLDELGILKQNDPT
jgi:hypothetical protein